MKIKGIVIFFILCLIPNVMLLAQGKEPIVVSPLIGEKLDRVERNYFKLFPHFEGFEEAVFYLNPDSSLMVEIWYQTDDGLRDTIIERYRSVSNLQYHIDQIILHPIPPSKQAKNGSFTKITLLDSNIVSGELFETGKYLLQIYDHDYKIPGKYDMGSSGYKKVNFNDINKISFLDTTNIAPVILGGLGGLAGLLLGINKSQQTSSGGSLSGFEKFGVMMYALIGSAIGVLLGNIIPIGVESKTVFEPPFNENDIKGLRYKTKKY